MVSTDTSLFKGEAPRFLADFIHPSQLRGPLSFRTISNGPWKLTEYLPCRTKIFVAPYLIDTDTEKDMDTDTDTETETDMERDTDMETDTDMDKDTDMELEYFARFPYSAIVAIEQVPTALPTCSATSQ